MDGLEKLYNQISQETKILYTLSGKNMTAKTSYKSSKKYILIKVYPDTFSISLSKKIIELFTPHSELLLDL